MKTRMIFMTLLLWGVSLFPQDYLDAIRPFRGMRGISGAESGVIPASMGANNALLGNPALLTYAEKTYFSADLSYDQVIGTSVFNSTVWEDPSTQKLRFNSLTHIKPLTVYRGALVLGINFQPVNSFHSISQFSDFDYDFDPDSVFAYKHLHEETGSLYALTMGGSVLVTMNTSIGASISYLMGENEFTRVYEETDPDDIYTFSRFIDSLQFNPRYRGFGMRVGLLSEVSETMNLGLSIEFPSRISVTESSSRDSIEWFDDGSSSSYYDEKWKGLDYAVWGPWRLGLGLGFIAEPLEASVNYRFNSYRSIAFRGDMYDPETGDNLEDVIDSQIKDNVQNVHEYSASLLWTLDPLNLSFAATLMNDPLNYRFDNIIHLDVGLGYQFRSGLGFTVAFRNEQWQSDLNHSVERTPDLPAIERSVDVENTFSKFQFGIKYIL